MQGYDLEITVLGDPKAQGRPRAAKRGKFIQVYDDPNSRKAKDNLLAVIHDEDIAGVGGTRAKTGKHSDGGALTSSPA
ncbi:MAG TPA: hypothetical protein P5031_08750 [Candidatus Syntrophosphaera sp.]|nr:hypothetical protein [Candidatus Syntrophosphaera sp.]HRT88302.1 hypothetical protein [Anaerohalosphaeraceae bacterium]